MIAPVLLVKEIIDRVVLLHRVGVGFTRRYAPERDASRMQFEAAPRQP